MPDKNIAILAGLSLLHWSIACGKESARITRLIVSTDSENYAAHARDAGAEIPFLRPEEFADHDATDLAVFDHALAWLKQHEDYVPEFCVHLRPTCPLRDPAELDAMVDILIKDPTLDSVRTVSPNAHTPYKSWFMSEEGHLSPILSHDSLEEPWNEPRQKLPPTYMHNGNIDVIRTTVITEKRSMSGTTIHGFIQDDSLDIDTEQDFARASLMMRRRKKPSHGKTFCFDIDGVIATLTPDLDYAQASPRQDMIQHINRLYELGHTIILMTARGAMTGINWRTVTRQQMDAWGVKYHDLLFDKPAADFYIDDRMASFEELENMMQHPEQI